MAATATNKRAERFSAVLASIKLGRNLTDAELADLLEIKPRQLRNWRSGYSRPPWDKAERLAEKLGMSTAEFMGYEVD